MSMFRAQAVQRKMLALSSASCGRPPLIPSPAKTACWQQPMKQHRRPPPQPAAAPNGMEASKEAARRAELLEALTKARASDAATERSHATFTEAHAGPSVLERMAEEWLAGSGEGERSVLEDAMHKVMDWYRIMHGHDGDDEFLAPVPPEL